MGRISNSNRREFLRRLSYAMLSGGTASLLPQLAFMPHAAAQTRGSGYRALVCVYLAGANDSFNWLVPRDSQVTGSRYDSYRQARGGVYSTTNTSGLALGFDDLLEITPSNQTIPYGLHPSCTDFTATNGANTQPHSGLRSLVQQGKAAFVCNTGPLIQPTTRTQYESGVGLPKQLFSHNDQELLWQIGIADANNPAARFGWGARVAKQVAGGPLANGLSPTLSAAGTQRFLIGDQILPYQLAPGGVDLIDNYTPGVTGNNFSQQRRAVLDDLLDDAYSSPFAREYARTISRSLSVGESLATLLNDPGGAGSISTVFPQGNTLADQLAIVARMIKISRNSLSAQRQVFFVRYGSFDLHNGMFAGAGAVATTGHGALLTPLNQALGAFWTALGEISAQSEVTTFTMSDFGRTLSGNGDGSDHAWGGNALVLGGSVDGNKLYGKYPRLALNANDNSAQEWSLARGQYIPTTSADQMAATLARWMGVTDSTALSAMFPLVGNFPSSNLGFMSGV